MVVTKNAFLLREYPGQLHANSLAVTTIASLVAGHVPKNIHHVVPRFQATARNLPPARPRFAVGACDKDSQDSQLDATDGLDGESLLPAYMS